MNHHHRSRRGKITVGHGRHEIKVFLGWEPLGIWTELLERGDIPSCAGDIDLIGTENLPDGFILHADIKSVRREIRWLARGRRCNTPK